MFVITDLNRYTYNCLMYHATAQKIGIDLQRLFNEAYASRKYIPENAQEELGINTLQTYDNLSGIELCTVLLNIGNSSIYNTSVEYDNTSDTIKYNASVDNEFLFPEIILSDFLINLKTLFESRENTQYGRFKHVIINVKFDSKSADEYIDFFKNAILKAFPGYGIDFILIKE